MKIENEISGRKITLYHTECTESTNTDAKAINSDGALVVADAQTNGRGRLGRSFVSKKGGIYMSLFLDINSPAADTLFLTSAAACAAAKAVDILSGKKCLIKWVNDIYLYGKKVCGILAEGIIENGKIKSAVLGVGVNLVKGYEFEDSLKEKAGFIFESGDFEALRERFINIFLDEFFSLFDNMKREKILSTYNEKNFLSGKDVSFYVNQEKHTGTVTGISEDIGLCVSDKNTKKPFVLTFGEVIEVL